MRTLALSMLLLLISTLAGAEDRVRVMKGGRMIQLGQTVAQVKEIFNNAGERPQVMAMDNYAQISFRSNTSSICPTTPCEMKLNFEDGILKLISVNECENEAQTLAFLQNFYGKTYSEKRASTKESYSYMFYGEESQANMFVAKTPGTQPLIMIMYSKAKTSI